MELVLGTSISRASNTFCVDFRHFVRLLYRTREVQFWVNYVCTRTKKLNGFINQNNFYSSLSIYMTPTYR